MLLSAAMVGCNASEPLANGGAGTGGPELPFGYSVSFSPRDSVFGDFGRVAGRGGVWRSLPGSSQLGIELPLTPISGSVAGGLAVFIAVTPRGDPAHPDSGRYSIGPDPDAFDGSGFIAGPVRRWRFLTPGFLDIEASDSGTLSALFAVRGLRIVDGVTRDTFAVTAVGEFQATRSDP